MIKVSCYNERCLTLNHKIHVSKVRKIIKFMKISDQQKKSEGKRFLELGERCKQNHEKNFMILLQIPDPVEHLMISRELHCLPGSDPLFMSLPFLAEQRGYQFTYIPAFYIEYNLI